MRNGYYCTLSHVRDLRRVIALRRMSVPKGFFRINSRRMQSAYNGIGPEAWSASFRSAITGALDFLEAPALIHDVEWSARRKSFWRFTASNLRLMVNSWKDAHFIAGVVAAVLCQCFGHRGYLAAGKRGRKK